MMAGDRKTGNCAFCHSPLLGRDAVAECSQCRTMQHRECWDEYGGCVVPGCEGHDARRAAPQADDRDPQMAVKKGWNDPDSRTVLTSAAVIVAVSLVAIVTAASVKMLEGSDTSTPMKSSPAASEVKKVKTEPAATASIRNLMIRVHRKINAGDWAGSLKYLSKRRLQMYAQQGDVALAWQSAMASDDLVGMIYPANLQVRRVLVRGRSAEFRLAIPRKDRRCYKGVTWAVRERGGWKFDPGSAGSPDRRAIGNQAMKNRATGC